MQKAFLFSAVFFVLVFNAVKAQAEDIAAQHEQVIQNSQQESVITESSPASIDETAVANEDKSSCEAKSEEKKQCDTSADDKIHPFIRMDMGFTYASFSYKNASLGEFQGMYDLGAGIQYKRGRFELNYQARQSVSNPISAIFGLGITEVSMNSIMLNAYYDFVKSKSFAMYIGAGAGGNFWNLKTHDSILHEDNEYSGTSFAGAGYLGMIIGLFAGLGMDLGLDYYFVNDLQMNTIMPKIGLRYTF